MPFVVAAKSRTALKSRERARADEIAFVELRA
jgi:hypothetical protein